ncbi:hypothetical protein FHS09_002726 [Microbulbifer rhizosphaerae]|uniref:Uncharacterized protein n=1 Tax=Microbulbifer rhizosphaerae TaxID=1562603 RepID=A0A7W4WDW3_9GAMM|nr:hypothetical protein [Microbulbifer rhizosphaerae]MBB3061883.1 hypothetical protein [Microbulbifer rhizosphaerae]
MSKSSAGTTEAPGKNVLAKSGLNKSILDQGWFEFRRQWLSHRRAAAEHESDLSGVRPRIGG